MDDMRKEKNENANLEDKPVSDNRVLLVVITIVTLILSLYGKLITIGWMTILLCWCLILPIHFILFTKSGIKLSMKKNKTKSDYKRFFALCITMLLYTFTFVDVGDSPSLNTAIDFIDSNILSIISFICFVTNIVLIYKSLREKKQ